LIEDDDAATSVFLIPVALLAFTATSTFAGCLIPERQWIVATILASETTPDRVEMAIQAGGSLKDELKADFIDILEVISEDKSEEAE